MTIPGVKGDAATLDGVPEIQADDPSPANVAPPVPPQGADEAVREPEEQEAPGRPAWMNRREEIASRFEEARNRREGEPQPFENANDPEVHYGRAPVEASEAQDEPPPPAPAQDEEPTFEIVVDGEKRRVTQSQLIANAQKNFAADRRLEEATRLRDEAVRAAAALRDRPQDVRPQDPPGHPQGTESEPAQADPRSDATGDEDLARLVERIQLGDPDDGVAAMREFIGHVVPNGGSVDMNRIQVGLRMARDEEELQKVMNEFPTKYPDIASDEHLAHTAYRHAAEGMKEDLRRLGITDDRLDQLTTFEDVGKVHRYFRVQGAEGIRTPSQISDEAVTKTRAWLGAVRGGQTPSGSAVDRADRKAGIMQQPRRISTSPQASPRPQRIEEQRSAAVAEMRKARGQPIA